VGKPLTYKKIKTIFFNFIICCRGEVAVAVYELGQVRKRLLYALFGLLVNAR